LRARCHVPHGALGPEVLEAEAWGAELIRCKPGYNTVLAARAREDAAERGWGEVPFGMECEEAVRQTMLQVANIPSGVRRIVIPVGSGMSLAGVLHGLLRTGRTIPVLGVVVGADPHRRLDRYAPPLWNMMASLVRAGVPYDLEVDVVIGEVVMDPIYEAKCLPFLEEDDLLWVVGVRNSHAAREEAA
jgi:hypothetical protein